MQGHVARTLPAATPGGRQSSGWLLFEGGRGCRVARRAQWERQMEVGTTSWDSPGGKHSRIPPTVPSFMVSLKPSRKKVAPLGQASSTVLPSRHLTGTIAESTLSALSSAPAHVRSR